MHGRGQERGGTFSGALVTPRSYCWPLCVLFVPPVKWEDTWVLGQQGRVGILELFPGDARNTPGLCVP